jgi:flagellar biosynthesis/type III secretory pathway protein FliH
VTYIALHRGSVATISTDNVVIPASDLHVLQSSLNLARLLEELMDTTKERVEQKIKSAQTEGYEEGYIRGLNEGRATFTATLSEAARELLLARRETTQSVAALAVRIVKHVALSIGSERTVASLIDSTLDECLTAAPLVIRVNPTNVRALELAIRARMNELGFDSQLVKIKADEALQKFECFIDSAAASVVASLDVQLKRIESALNEESKIFSDFSSPVEMSTEKMQHSNPGQCKFL